MNFNIATTYIKIPFEQIRVLRHERQRESLFLVYGTEITKNHLLEYEEKHDLFDRTPYYEEGMDEYEVSNFIADLLAADYGLDFIEWPCHFKSANKGFGIFGICIHEFHISRRDNLSKIIKNIYNTSPSELACLPSTYEINQKILDDIIVRERSDLMLQKSKYLDYVFSDQIKQIGTLASHFNTAPAWHIMSGLCNCE